MCSDGWDSGEPGLARVAVCAWAFVPLPTRRRGAGEVTTPWYAGGVMKTHRAREITIRKARLGEEDDRLDREFWARLPPEERVEETWWLSLELWEMKGWDTGEPGLCRLVARVV